MKRLSFFILVLGLQGCVTPRICTPGGSYESGRQEALDGRSMNLSSGQVCSGDQLAVFQSNYQRGYTDGLALLCRESNVIDEGGSLGQQGQPDPGLPQRYRVCLSNLGALEKAWQAAHARSLQAFCSPEAAQALGEKAGSAGTQLEPGSQAWQVCGEKQVDRLSRSYASGHGQGLKRFCAASNLETRAFQAGRNNQGPLNIDALFQPCPDGERSRLRQRHDLAFRKGARDYCQISNHMDMIREWAAKKSQPYVTTGRFEICMQNFPDLHAQYDAVYAQERQAIVSRYCTYDNGQAHGRDDAASHVNPRRDSPEYCDDSVSANFMRGYDRGWDEQKRSLCTSEDSLNEGYQDGLRGVQPNPSYPELCPVHYHAGIRSSYLDGYDRGLQVYQTQVQAQAEASRVVVVPQESHHTQPHHHTHQQPRPSTDGDAVQACAEVVSYDGDKLKCIQTSGQIRHNPAALIRACGEAFSYHGDRLQCVVDAGSRNYSPAATVKACQQIVSYSGDIQKCMNAVKTSRFEPSRAVRACGEAFSYHGDRIKCLSAVASSQRDPSPRISSCRQNFSYAGDIMKCLGGTE